MRFETTEKIRQEDTELVLRTLEVCLRDVSTDVQRSGEEIVLHGLGPSPLAVNRHDTTVLRVENEESEHVTVIRADVTFQASSLLGNTPQCDIVRSKLDRVFERVRMQIDFETGNFVRKPAKVPEVAAKFAEITPQAEVPQQVEPHLLPSIEGTDESFQPAIDSMPQVEEEQTETAEVELISEVKGVEALVSDVKPEAALIHDESSDAAKAEVAPEMNVNERREPGQVQPLAELPATEFSSEAAEAIIDASGATAVSFEEAAPAPVFSGKKSITRAVFVETLQTAEEPTFVGTSFASIKSYVEPRHNWTAAMLAAALLLFGPGLYLAHHQQQQIPAPQPQPPAVHATELDPTPPPSQPPEPTSETSATDKNSRSSDSDSSDPQIWLQGWLQTQATGDAAAQASFYAGNVDRYLGRRNVTNAEILAEKQSAMLRRQGRWTVKLEDVNLHRQDNGEVSVYLVKHYEAQTEPAEIAEQFVPSHLQLRSIDGQWKIVSEQDMQTIEPAPTH